MYQNFKTLIKKLLKIYRYSTFDVEKAEECFYINYINPGMVVFDVGANIGELTLLFSRFAGKNGTVHAFEGSHDTFSRLSNIISLANKDNVILNNKILSDSEELVNLYSYNEEFSGWTSLANRPLQNYGIDIMPERIEKVFSTTIDNYCLVHGIDEIDLLKIDVEGAEYQVLLGTKKMLKSHRIKCLTFEFGQTTYDMGNSPEQISALLNDCGYKIFNVIPGAPIFPGGNSARTAQFSMHLAKPKGYTNNFFNRKKPKNISFDLNQ